LVVFLKVLKVDNNVINIKMYLLILFLPLLGSITAGLFGRKLGSSGAQFTSIACLGSAAVLALISFYEIAICDSPVSINLGS
jgi:NADH-ubiquinone oxidoreductase chain 5